jgi:hypothetical protein
LSSPNRAAHSFSISSFSRHPVRSARPGVAPDVLADPRRIADAALFLANQDARSATHELQLTPLADSWTP